MYGLIIVKYSAIVLSLLPYSSVNKRGVTHTQALDLLSLHTVVHEVLATLDDGKTR